MDALSMIAAVASAASYSMIGAMTSDAWAGVRERVRASVVSPSSGETAVLSALDEIHGSLNEADGPADAAVVAEAQNRLENVLRQLLEDRPDLVESFRVLADDFAGSRPATASLAPQSAIATDEAHQAVQYQGLQINSFGETPSA